MINIDPRFLGELAERLDFWPGTHWILAIFPVWALVLVPLILSFGPYLTARVFIEFQALELHKQYKGFWPGDLFFGLALGLAMVGMAFYASPVVSSFWGSIFWNMLVALVCLGALFGLWAVELNVAIKNRKLSDDKRDPKAYTLYQLFTPTSLVHRYIMFLYAYLFMKVGVVAMCTGAVPVWIKMAMGGLFLLWAYCVKLDNSNTRPNLAAVHPMTHAWFTGWKRKPAPKMPKAPSYPTQPAGDATIAAGWRRPVSGDARTDYYGTGGSAGTHSAAPAGTPQGDAPAARPPRSTEHTRAMPSFTTIGDQPTGPINPAKATRPAPKPQSGKGGTGRQPGSKPGGGMPPFPTIGGDN
jgi:hypothetical protein